MHIDNAFGDEKFDRSTIAFINEEEGIGGSVAFQRMGDKEAVITLFS